VLVAATLRAPVAVSTATTLKVYVPSVETVKVWLPEQAVGPATVVDPLSSEHWSAVPAGVVNDQVGVLSLSGLVGAPVMVGDGGGMIRWRV
jgi:hypothetical protein